MSKPDKISEEKATPAVDKEERRADDRPCILAVQKGDKAAFEELVKKYQKRLMRFVIMMLGRRDPADDIVQEAFVKAYLAINSFEPDRPFYPWLATIARNLAINRIKKEDREKPASEYEEINELQTDESSNPLAEMMSKENDRRLMQAVKSLAPQFREVFVLRMIENMSYDEIAAKLNISAGTVDSRLHRAREKLVQMLKDLL